MVTCSKLPSEDGSVISNESEKLNSGRGLTVPKVTAQQKLTKEATRKRDGESFTLMQIQRIYSASPLQTRSYVSQIPKKSQLCLLLHVIRLQFNFLMHTGTLKRNAQPLQLFFLLPERLPLSSKQRWT